MRKPHAKSAIQKVVGLAFFRTMKDEIIDGQNEYNIKDHLRKFEGCFQEILWALRKITQANSYGIFGEDLTSLNYLKSTWKADNFKFTGKESFHKERVLLIFGARWYDNIVPRFTTIDPLSEISREDLALGLRQ
ncbi:MAG: hypothetical protein U5N85_07460 [Arcicella sp.]|nr:hypothetical protein [Arcicella sp.]